MDKPVMMGSLSALSEQPFDWKGAHRVVSEHAVSTQGPVVRSASEDESAVLFNLDVLSFTQVRAFGHDSMA
jgi:hypothetical protein